MRQHDVSFILVAGLIGVLSGAACSAGGGGGHRDGSTGEDLARACALAGRSCGPSTNCCAGTECQNGTCVPVGPCGQTGEPCCAGASPCVAAGATCDSNGLCVGQQPCGSVGEPCCNGTTCNGTGTSCVGGTCVSGGQCGHIGESCCGGTTCVDVGAICLDGACMAQPCGTLDQPCCGGTSCTGGLTCQNGLCVGQQACGSVGEPCCNGTSCSVGTCVGGFCQQQACGAVGEPCCNGSACNAGAVCQNGTCASAGTDPVGHTCSASTQCTGASPSCMSTFAGVSAPGGYCTNACQTDANCGTGGYCTGAGGFCVGNCSGANQCQTVNPNNRCFFSADSVHAGACLPVSASQCDPTQSGTCSGTGACLVVGYDNVGTCGTVCSFGGTCPADTSGNAQNCYLYNERYDVNGTPTSDTFAGLVCLFAGTNAAATACTYINDCTAGYECDVFGSKLCKQLCQNGMTTCTSGTCTNSFKLATWGTGSVGLCI